MFVEFDKLWMEEKPNIMQFNEMRDKYEAILKSKLAGSKVVLSLESSDSNLLEQEC